MVLSLNTNHMKYSLFLLLFLCLHVSLHGQCDLPPDRGPCAAEITRYYFDSNGEDCFTFIYGGCSGNANNFATYELCMTHCAPQCYLPVDPGIGPRNQQRWYYNRSTRTCDSFMYRGSGGNANRYASKAECQESCGVDCYLPPEKGPCNAAIERFYFDPPTNTCKTFIYGGCGGNANNYPNLVSCLNACVLPCDQLPHRGPCHAYLVRYYYDKNDETCKTFIFGGCDANDNNFATFELCMASCPCKSTETDDELYAAGSKRRISASENIISTAIMTDSSSLIYKAGIQVDFLNGFRIDEASQLEVLLDGCQ